MVMVIAFCVMFSTFLSGPVAMVATFVCVLLGFAAEQIYDIRYYMDRNEAMGGGPVESLVRLLRQDAMTTQLDVDTALPTCDSHGRCRCDLYARCDCDFAA